MQNTGQSKAIAIILSAPSGGGKSSIAKELLAYDQNLVLSISATTRKPRNGEIEGKHYFFKSRDEFLEMIKNDELLEYAEIYHHLYGTPKDYVTTKLAQGFDVLFDIDYQGAKQIRTKMPKNCLSIFIVPPGLEVLRERIEARGEDSKENIDLRMKLAAEEMSYAKDYDYVVENDIFEQTVEKIRNIINMERGKKQ